MPAIPPKARATERQSPAEPREGGDVALEERLLAPLPNATWTATPEWDRRSSITATCVRTPR